MAKTVRLCDIAKIAGVSSVSVSKALSGKDGVSDELRERIIKISEQLGYKSVSSKVVPWGKTGNIGVLTAEQFIQQDNSFYWEMYQNVVTALSDKGYLSILELVTPEMEKNLEMPKTIVERKIDGMIIIGTLNKEYNKFVWHDGRVPIMFIDAYEAHMDYDAVISDGYYGMYTMTNYLIAHGHKDIGFVGNILATSSITDRYLGFCKAMMEAGLEVRDEWVIPDRDNVAMLNIDELPEKLPTAFAANCDNSAYELINRLKEKGIRCPEDISIVGFDNYINVDSNPEITTYSVSMKKMAKVGVRNLIRKVIHREYNKGLQLVTGQLIIKGSVNHRSLKDPAFFDN